MKKILCMFSGGLDSYGAAWHLLTQDAYRDHRIHLHHLRIDNREQRISAEDKAVRSFVDFCRSRNMDFDWTQQYLDFTFMTGRLPWDFHVGAFMVLRSREDVIKKA